MAKESKSGELITNESDEAVKAGTVCVWRPFYEFVKIDGLVVEASFCEELTLNDAAHRFLDFAICKMQIEHGVSPRPYDFISAKYLTNGNLEFTFVPTCLIDLMY